ncbi:MAG: glutathione S-transferase family protein [Geminicoccaceae bacterium]|nr:glutathione S-transferase family protein [Geminicoccaceae bacterium]
MSSTSLNLVIGNYNTSSWSLRAWLVMRLAGVAFEEVRVPLGQGETQDLLRDYSPSGRVPVLEVDGFLVWDSLAIAEFMAELVPGLWPEEATKRAVARAVSAEMHSGFRDLRTFMPLDVTGRFGPPGRLMRGVARDVARLKAVWRTCRERHGGGGPFLFGPFCIADAMMAPVASRFVTYGVALEPDIEDYVDGLMAWPAMTDWQEAAAREVEAKDKGALGVVRVRRAGRALDDLGRAAPAPPSPIAERPAAAPPSPLKEGPTEAPPLAVPPVPKPLEAATKPPSEPLRPAPSPPAEGRSWPRRANDVPRPKPPPQAPPPVVLAKPPPEAPPVYPPLPRPEPVVERPAGAFRAPSRPREPGTGPGRADDAGPPIVPTPPPRAEDAKAPPPDEPPLAVRHREDDLPDHLRRWRPAGSGVKPIGDGTRRRR